jgi:hypothetical protein
MLWIIAVVLTLWWVLGLAASFTMGGFIHALFVAAAVLVIVQFSRNRRELFEQNRVMDAGDTRRKPQP